MVNIYNPLQITHTGTCNCGECEQKKGLYVTKAREVLTKASTQNMADLAKTTPVKVFTHALLTTNSKLCDDQSCLHIRLAFLFSLLATIAMLV